MTILGNRLLAEKIIDDKKSAGGIILPTQNKYEAKVLIIGSKVEHVKVGDTIRYHQGSGTEIEYLGMDCLFLNEEFDCEAVL